MIVFLANVSYIYIYVPPVEGCYEKHVFAYDKLLYCQRKGRFIERCRRGDEGTVFQKGTAGSWLKKPATSSSIILGGYGTVKMLP